MTTPETLRAARALLTPEGAWTQGAAARDKYGREVPALHPDAVSWDIGSAILVAKPGITGLAYSLAIDAFRAAAGVTGFLSAWGDDEHRTQADILAAFDRAIGEAEKR